MFHKFEYNFNGYEYKSYKKCDIQLILKKLTIISKVNKVLKNTKCYVF